MAPAPVVLRQPQEVRALVRRWRREEQRVVLVPTMGYLHDGHLSLVRAGSTLGPVVVSIFVNPTQFAPGEDFESYPRDLERDLRILAEEPAAAVFVPDRATMYPDAADTWVEVQQLSAPLCGAHRPGHFRGVATVVAKLFGIVQPDVAVFGQKDAQQCLVVHRMTQDLSLPIDLVFAPTVREPSGLAMSSRNRYLSSEERSSALRLGASLRKGRELLAAGERRRQAVEAGMHSGLEDLIVDYAQARMVPSLAIADPIPDGRVLLAIAARLGNARLIDNVCLRVTPDGVVESPLLDECTLDSVAARLAAAPSEARDV